MTNNDFSVARGYKRMLAARSGTRSQESIITDLKSELEPLSEVSLLTHSMRLILELDFRQTSELYNHLESPMKQALYLIDVFYSMGDKGGTEELSKDRIERVSLLLDEMETAYFASIAFPNDGDIFHDDRDDMIEVSLPTFLNHFSNAKLCYEEQTLDRIVRYFTPYDNWIKSKYGFTVDEAIKFILHVRHLNNNKFSSTVLKGSKYAFYATHPDEWAKLTTEFERRGIEPEKWASQPELEGIFDMMSTNPGEICLHSKEELLDVDLPDDVKDSLLRFFVYDRGEAEKKGTIYYADSHISEDMPLFRMGDQFICPINKFLLEALYNRLSSDLQKSVSKFKRNKDHAFENKIYDIFHRFFPEKTKIFSNYSVDGTSENDLLIGYGTTWIIVEIKNTGFRPPMRDPLKAFNKIKSDFDKSVQLGYEQCYRVENILKAGSDVEIRDADSGKLLYQLRSKNIGDVWSIVVTDYKYGPIQTDLSKLLKKDDEALYPWSVCADDLETLLLLMKKLFKGIAPNRFMEFLDYRERYQGHVTCFDEMEICGWYLCDREQFKKYADIDSMIGTIPGMAEIFDAYFRIGLGFSNELDMEAKKHYKLQDYSREFAMDVVTSEDFPNLQ